MSKDWQNSLALILMLLSYPLITWNLYRSARYGRMTPERRILPLFGLVVWVIAVPTFFYAFGSRQMLAEIWMALIKPWVA
ncbi:hypothetical protein FNL55_15760 [Tardiphaga sp. vice352]|uniref:hypothetical protein n=1 Tax=Tardiphaga sp. vice352 TaxID=2592816 RepID=UPI0011620ACD|nr:hypothetical protein [Tardiphaga sp. vice352]QDM32643.1 hypothetical protein FNL55_15760 [Tardiphaga sp. vice352]